MRLLPRDVLTLDFLQLGGSVIESQRDVSLINTSGCGACVLLAAGFAPGRERSEYC